MNAEPPPTDRAMDHDYDGIQEYDNPLPGWWRAAFWGAIVFAFGYVAWFHVLGRGTTPAEAYRSDLADYNGKRERRDLAEAANVSEEILARDAHDPKVVDHGAAVFAARCVPCHTADGHGLIGPNLTDLFQIHGDTRMDIFKTIRGGVPGTPMLAWGEQMPPTDIVAVAVFATMLRGKNIPGKAPQGHKVEAFK
ncbi:MAG: cbb3-type cytochrome c oxidase N-terminal domain-containing protein [Kofleriaceae bacterium]